MPFKDIVSTEDRAEVVVVADVVAFWDATGAAWDTRGKRSIVMRVESNIVRSWL